MSGDVFYYTRIAFCDALAHLGKLVSGGFTHNFAQELIVHYACRYLEARVTLPR